MNLRGFRYSELVEALAATVPTPVLHAQVEAELHLREAEATDAVLTAFPS